MRFSDIVGQPVLVKSLSKAIEDNKVANGYIFAGPKGCGKKLTAFVFALSLNCKEQIGEKPCNLCSSCIKFKNGNHPNIEIIKPTGASIKIKQIRQIISDVSKTSLESGYRVIIVDNAEKMTHEAQDAFLKTLEEPPVNTLFILLVENQHSLLPTIVSRCQVFTLKSVSADSIKDYLMKNCSSDISKVKLATAHSNGIIGRAVQILQDESYFKTRDIFIKAVTKLFENSYSEISLLVNENISGKEEAEEFLGFLLHWFRDMLVIKEISDAPENLIVNIDKIEELTFYANALTESKLNSILDIIKNTIKYIRHNVTVRNSLDGMILSIMEVNNG